MTKTSDGSSPSPGDDSSASSTLTTPVGPIAVSGNGRSIIRVEWLREPAEAVAGQPRQAGSGSSSGAGARAGAGSPDDLLIDAVEQLARYFAGALTTFDLPLDFGGISAIARTVLTTLAETVGQGSTITYGELAERSQTGIPARAVGGIMGLNPIPIIVPCHRVVAGDGLGGYSGGLPGRGLETKRWLLEWEEALPRPLF